MNWLLAEHSSFAANVESGLMRSKALMASTNGALNDVATLFDETENDAQVDVRDLFNDLDPTAATAPLTASTERQSLAFASPVDTLVPPESSLANPAFQVVWNVINWPDYLSLSYWARQIINGVIQLIQPGWTGGQDVFEFLAQKISGDWDKVALAGSAFGYVGDFFALAAVDPAWRKAFEPRIQVLAEPPVPDDEQRRALDAAVDEARRNTVRPSGYQEAAEAADVVRRATLTEDAIREEELNGWSHVHEADDGSDDPMVSDR